ncbi:MULTISPECIES: LexA family transcriptional regulator [Burkholderia]|uniref:LexA family transcriptional regulator n=1 Tax=Burkholderia TaxID=32008 RepID=UPI000F5F9602|nr:MULTISPECIES: helix-turn-helix transcriptional regulator [Burkholderia]RQZ74829.1 helix-turn-helix transcriptional regulator [Burkholderia glumae]
MIDQAMDNAKVLDANSCATLPERVSFLIGICGGPAETARRVGVSNTTLQRWRNGEVDLSTSNLVKLADEAGASVEWLATGRGSWRVGLAVEKSDASGHLDTQGNPVDITEFVFVPRFNVKAAAGHGSALGDDKPPLAMAFRRYWIDNFLRVSPRDLAVISVKGDSMEGVLNDRDVILVNQADTRPGAGLYVLRMDGELFVKRLQRLPEGRLEVSSANDAYRPFTIDMASPPSDFDIIGRVVWFGRQV